MAPGQFWRLSDRQYARRYRRPVPNRSRRKPVTSPTSNKPQPPDRSIVVGRVIRAHGLDGSLRIQPYSDNPSRFRPGGLLTLGGKSRTVDSYRLLPDGYAILRLDDLNNALAARKLTGEWLYACTDPEPKLPPGEYYHYQLVGLTVVTDQGEILGRVQGVFATGSNDVYVVKSEFGTELLLPATSQVVKEIDLSSQRILVHLLDGLR